jgi:poly-gamma-glutamate synthesis protein (capsule biosynthesis protein)
MKKNGLAALYIFTFLCLFLPKNNLLAAESDSLLIIHFAGDVVFANHFEYYVKNRFDYPFKRFPEFGRADISMVNLENPLTTSRDASDKTFVFRARPDYVRVLQNGGVDLVTLANNHMYDYKEAGMLETIRHLDEAGILHVGAGKNEQAARSAVIIHKKKVRLGFLGYYGLRRHSGCHPATADSAGTALRKLRLIRQDIRALRDSVDFIFVNFHWGLEKEHLPQDEQIWFAHKTIDYGADMIIGHHPHVLQGIEKYKGKYIVYSLGNFIFGGNSRKHESTAILRVTINTITRTLQPVSILPVQVDYWQPHLLSGEPARAVMDSVQHYSSVFEESGL